MKIGKAAMIASLAMLGSYAQTYVASGREVLTKDKCKLKEVGGRYGCLVGGPEVEVSADVYDMLPKSIDTRDDKKTQKN